MAAKGEQDRDLLVAAGTSPDAFAAFYDRHERSLLGWFAVRCRDPEVAADLTAETFAAVLIECRRRKVVVEHPSAWLFTIAQNKLADFKRRGRIDARARRRIGMGPVSYSDETLVRIEGLMDAGTRDAVRAGLASLPDDQRRAVVGRVVDEKDYVELARDLEVSPTVARQRVSRGLRRLRLRLKELTQ